MKNSEYINLAKYFFVEEYINNIMKKTNKENITNGKYSFLVSLFYYNDVLDIPRKQAIDILYNIARNDEKISEKMRTREEIAHNE